MYDLTDSNALVAYDTKFPDPCTTEKFTLSRVSSRVSTDSSAENNFVRRDRVDCVIESRDIKGLFKLNAAELAAIASERAYK